MGQRSQPPVTLGRPQRNVLSEVRTVGRRQALYQDFYYFVLVRPWWQFISLASSAYLLLNLLFACLYAAETGSVAGAKSFADLFFSSIQTMGTIGYGALTPATPYSNVLVTIESLVGMFFVAMLTGLAFSKFTKPSARVLFSEVCVVHNRDGRPHLVCRLANYRHNQIVEAQLRFTLIVEDRTAEGETYRRPIDLKLVRDKSTSFFLSWLAMHPIDADSPFASEGALERYASQGALLIVSLIGWDETLSQTVHTRHVYNMSNIVPNARFVDIIRIHSDGTREIDYGKFHETIPVER